MEAERQPIVSAEFADGTLLETVYDADRVATTLAVRHADGSHQLVPEWEHPDGRRLVPYSATNNLIASGCVLLPSDIGDFGDKEDLVDDIRAYLARYVELSPSFMDIAPYYILLSWVYDDFREMPLLRARGGFGCGKTRFLLTVGSISYKPFFASGASTVSPIFHILDTVRGTLIMDEADFRFTDATNELTKILNNGTVDGLPVLRTMTNRHRELNPKAFRVYGPKIVGMRESFDDPALESRFFTEEMASRTLSPHIPIHTPTSLAEDALRLRNRLLAWRFAAKGTMQLDSARLLPGVPPRLNQMAIALLSIVDDDATRQRIAAAIVAQGEEREERRQESQDAVLVRAIIETLDSAPDRHAPVGDIAELFNRKTSGKFHLPLSPKAVGSIIRTRLRLQTAKSHGVYVVSQNERQALRQIAHRMGVSIDVVPYPHEPESNPDLRASCENA